MNTREYEHSFIEEEEERKKTQHKHKGNMPPGITLSFPTNPRRVPQGVWGEGTAL